MLGTGGVVMKVKGTSIKGGREFGNGRVDK